MNVEPRLSGHGTDEQLIAELYVGPENGHVHSCAECQARLAQMRDGRQAVEQSAASGEEPGFDFLAGQRRRIYARITEPSRWWQTQPARWTSAAALLLLLGGGLVRYEQLQREQEGNDRVTDAQLALEVSRISENPEAQPTAPLQALFEE